MTDAKEVAIDAPERANSPTWPTNMTEIVCTSDNKRLTNIMGPARNSCNFVSAKISSLVNSEFESGSFFWELETNGVTRSAFSS